MIKKFFKNLFSQPINKELQEAILHADCLVDVRSEGEFATGSVPGAINIPLPALSSQAGTLKDKKQIVVFCQSGGRSASAVSVLRRAGCKNIHNGGSIRNVQKLQNG